MRLLLIFVLMSQFLVACIDQEPSELLWKITNDSQSIFVQGVVHYGPEKYVTPSARTLRVFNSAKHIIVEAIDDAPQKEFKQISVDLSENNKKLLTAFLDRLSADGLMSSQEYADALETDVAYYGYAFNQAFSARIHRSKIPRQILSPTKLGIDSVLGKSAMALGKHVSALEQHYNQRITWHKTCNVNTLFPDILKSFEKMIYEDQGFLTMHEIQKYAFQGDAEALRTKTTELEHILPHNKINAECSYNVRTHQWAENWDSVMKRAPNGLVLIGAHHVIQEPSLLTLLAKKGYSIERIH